MRNCLSTGFELPTPGGKALAGYLDPHTEAHPMSFYCLQRRANQSVVEAFLSKLFVNDIECLQQDGVLQEMLVACAATLLGWYNDLERDVGGSNDIVSKICMAVQELDIKDSTITATVGAPMWLLTLKSWSKMTLKLKTQRVFHQMQRGIGVLMNNSAVCYQGEASLSQQ
jgi:hypothetical protein